MSSTPALKNIAILGARGNVGMALIAELLALPSPPTITAISRTSTSTPFPFPATSPFALKTVDYTSLDSLKAAFANQDAVVNCITGGATQYDASKPIIDAAVAAGVKFYFANEFVANIFSEQFRRLPEAAAGSKFRIREYLEGLGREGKMQWTALNGGPFFDMWLMKGVAGFDVKNKQARIYGSGANPLFWTPLPVLARAAAHMLAHPDAITNRGIFICPFAPGSLTQNSLLAALEKVLDTKFSVTNVDVEKINRHARIALERGDVKNAMRGLAVSNQFYEGDSGNNLEGLVENEVVGVREMGVEEAVREAVERYGVEGDVVEGMFRVEACEV